MILKICRTSKVSEFATSFPRAHGACRPYLATKTASCHLWGALTTTSGAEACEIYLLNFFTVVPVHVAAGDTGIQFLVLSKYSHNESHGQTLHVRHRYSTKSNAIARFAFCLARFPLAQRIYSISRFVSESADEMGGRRSVYLFRFRSILAILTLVLPA